VPEAFQSYIEINARIAGQPAIESPDEEKPQPTAEEVVENREQWRQQLR
jgi:hypothetical protein